RHEGQRAVVETFQQLGRAVGIGLVVEVPLRGDAGVRNDQRGWLAGAQLRSAHSDRSAGLSRISRITATISKSWTLTRARFTALIHARRRASSSGVGSASSRAFRSANRARSTRSSIATRSSYQEILGLLAEALALARRCRVAADG